VTAVLSVNEATHGEFVRLWHQPYTADDDAFYHANIGQQLTATRI
jgi:hypothetical protein